MLLSCMQQKTTTEFIESATLKTAMKLVVIGILFIAAELLTVQCSSVCYPEGDRDDCGYYGIKRKECEEKGCCWSPDDGSWCFYKTEEECIVEPGDRTDCGYLGIGEDECENKGCCWSPTDEPERPWCFDKAVATEPPAATTQPPAATTESPADGFASTWWRKLMAKVKKAKVKKARAHH